jgi:hypothetical protein
MNISSVSYSSDKSLARCERQWTYKYQEGLRPKVKGAGLFFGDFMHKILRGHYLGEDWKKIFAKLKKKLWTPLFDEEKEFYGEDFPDRVHDLAEHYFDYYAKTDAKWKIIKCEEKISLPTKFGFPVTFIADLIVQDGKWKLLVETKNNKKIPDASMRLFNVQPHSYSFLLKRIGIKIDQIVWNYLRTEPVSAPKILQSGALSSREINTDQRTVRRVLQENKLNEADHKELLDSLPVTLSLERHTSTPNLKVGQLFVRDWIDRARRMQNVTRATRNFNKNCSFDCDFYNLCTSDMENKVDRNLIIKRDFVKRGEE